MPLHIDSVNYLIQLTLDLLSVTKLDEHYFLKLSPIRPPRIHILNKVTGHYNQYMSYVTSVERDPVKATFGHLYFCYHVYNGEVSVVVLPFFEQPLWFTNSTLVDYKVFQEEVDQNVEPTFFKRASDKNYLT